MSIVMCFYEDDIHLESPLPAVNDILFWSANVYFLSFHVQLRIVTKIETLQKFLLIHYVMFDAIIGLGGFVKMFRWKGWF